MLYLIGSCVQETTLFGQAELIEVRRKCGVQATTTFPAGQQQPGTVGQVVFTGT
jgi:hypothetical protein